MTSRTTTRIERTPAPPACPRCESFEVLPTLYGLPDYDWKVEQGKVAIMGCDLPMSAAWDDIPEWECQVCSLLF